MSDKLFEAILTVQSGDKKLGRKLLSQYIISEPRNDAAWTWLAGILNDKERIRYCLVRALRLNPNNKKAWNLLGSLMVKEGYLWRGNAGNRNRNTTPTSIYHQAASSSAGRIYNVTISRLPTPHILGDVIGLGLAGTPAKLEIDVINNKIILQTRSRLGHHSRKELHFLQIVSVSSQDLGLLTIMRDDLKLIELRNVERLFEILDVLSRFVHDMTEPWMRERIANHTALAANHTALARTQRTH